MEAILDNKSQLIQCGDHSWAPWSVICVHLMEGDSKEWMAMPSVHPEVDHDFICPACHEQGGEVGWEAMMDKLKAVCIHCVRKLQAEPNINIHKCECCGDDNELD